MGCKQDRKQDLNRIQDTGCKEDRTYCLIWHLSFPKNQVHYVDAHIATIPILKELKTLCAVVVFYGVTVHCSVPPINPVKHVTRCTATKAAGQINSSHHNRGPHTPLYVLYYMYTNVTCTVSFLSPCFFLPSEDISSLMDFKEHLLTIPEPRGIFI